MKYIVMILVMVAFVGCGGGSGDGKVLTTDPTQPIKTKDSSNTPPAVPEI
jgi:hypothetical protein